MITVQLTSLENHALQLAGNAEDSQIKNFIFLDLVMKGMANDEASTRADDLAAAALSARRKIAEALQYQIEVVD
jgi:hypothetical protein